MSEICKWTSGLLRVFEVSTSLTLPPTVYTACSLGSGWLYLQWSHGPGITNMLRSPFWLKFHLHQWPLLASLEEDSDFSKQWQDSTSLWLIMPFNSSTMWKILCQLLLPLWCVPLVLCEQLLLCANSEKIFLRRFHFYDAVLLIIADLFALTCQNLLSR